MARLSAPYALRQSKRADFMVGSERMLKAHHKNGVFSKSLENKKHEYDASCYKNLSKIQQDIYDVYFNEYLPLKEQAAKTKFFPKLAEKKSPKYRKIASIKGNEHAFKLPDIHSDKSSSDFKMRYKKSDCFIETLREKEALKKNERRPTMASRFELGLPNGGLFSQCSSWSDTLPGCRTSPDIDDYQLKIIKAAIALTSEPAKTPDCLKRPRRLRRSFLLTLRRTSKTVWENDLLKRAGPAPGMTRMGSYRDSVRDSLIMESDENDVTSRSAINSAVFKWRPSISKNRILNDDDDDDDDIVFQFSDRQSRQSFVSMISEAIGKTPRLSAISDAPLHDIEDDLYVPDLSPDIFSVISERTGSSYSDYSSYTSGSGSESGSESYYSSESDDTCFN